ncbi:MAG: cupin domain-containing protein [Ferruginibacter sp.]
MNNQITNYITRSNQTTWAPLMEEGIATKGIFVKVLRYDEETKRAPTILLKFEAGARYPYHNHPGGEEIFVLEGDATLEGEKLLAGDYLYTAPNFKHSVHSENGCVLLFVVPEEVEILKS